MFQSLANLITGALVAASALLGGTTALPSPTPSPQVIPGYQADASTTYKSEGKYSYLGQSVNYSLEFPVAGGDVKGTFSGACTGTVAGNYDAYNKNLDGNVSGSCNNMFYKGSFNQAYGGSVDQSQKQIHFQVKSDNSTVSKIGQADLPLASY